MTARLAHERRERLTYRAATTQSVTGGSVRPASDTPRLQPDKEAHMRTIRNTLTNHWMTLAALIALIVAIALYPADGAKASNTATQTRPCGVGPRPVIAPPVLVKDRATPAQRRNITTALNVAHRMRSPRNHRIALVAAIIAENNGHNKPWGHSSSVGILQLLNIHGSPPYSVNPSANIAWRMKIRNSVGWFLRGAKSIDPRGYLDPATLAGRVQRPRGGSAVYTPWVPRASRIVAKWYATACKVPTPDRKDAA